MSTSFDKSRRRLIADEGWLPKFRTLMCTRESQTERRVPPGVRVIFEREPSSTVQLTRMVQILTPTIGTVTVAGYLYLLEGDAIPRRTCDRHRQAIDEGALGYMAENHGSAQPMNPVSSTPRTCLPTKRMTSRKYRLNPHGVMSNR